MDYSVRLTYRVEDFGEDDLDDLVGRLRPGVICALREDLLSLTLVVAAQDSLTDALRSAETAVSVPAPLVAAEAREDPEVALSAD